LVSETLAESVFAVYKNGEENTIVFSSLIELPTATPAWLFMGRQCGYG
jgi:hypothetical protein